MVNKMRHFRTKMVWLFGLSMFLSGIITYIIYKVLQLYYHTMVDYGDPLAQIRIFINNIGDINIFLLFFVPISILFFLRLTKPYSEYFKELSNGIHALAHSDFTHRVPVRSNDEFSDIARDINLANEELKEAIERGDFSESSKDQLIVNLAHDLRTPLTSVLGYIEVILKDENLTEEQVKHYLTIALTKSQRLERLIEELFEITRLNYGKLPMKKQPIDVSELLQQLKEELYPVFEHNQLTARMNITSSLPITGDGEQLARVFENLLMNANRYGYDGEFIDVNGFMDTDEVVVQVVNYGDSIPSDELPHIFDMLYTGDKARTQKENSTGLGLFIAKNIVEQHSGTITVDSDVIRTMFEVRLPHGNEADHAPI
ncbi:HAMP domain-containing sensor histidine kinase [Salibacterium aidingense]|uniref:HAMP domain-containing sensor histidine kinase n=1 Tax=Salibacterium aidingense TaxID=384933 RepID=UPI003BBE95EB